MLAAKATSQSVNVEEARWAFRGAVAVYQMFVVPHCTPQIVKAYVSARHARDQAFVESLRGTMLEQDYAEAVALQAAQDSHTVYECALPPAPPPLPGMEPVPETAEEQQERARKSLQQHFDGGDQQFSRLVRLRDQIMAAGEEQVRSR